MSTTIRSSHYSAHVRVAPIGLHTCAVHDDWDKRVTRALSERWSLVDALCLAAERTEDAALRLSGAASHALRIEHVPFGSVQSESGLGKLFLQQIEEGLFSRVARQGDISTIRGRYFDNFETLLALVIWARSIGVPAEEIAGYIDVGVETILSWEDTARSS